MRKTKFELMTSEELITINNVVEPRYGISHMVISGSLSRVDGKKVCNISIGDTNSHQSLRDSEGIGSLVKSILGVSEVYCGGRQIA